MKVNPSQETGKSRVRAQIGQLSDMDLRLLKVFRTVVDCGGMAAAELELHIGTSTISRHVKDLESRLGFVLCRRGRSGFALTDDGQRVYEEVLRLLSAVDSFRNSINDLHMRLGGQLEVAMFDKIATNPAAQVSKAIARFTELAPDVRLSLHVASTPAIERGVIDGRFQLGLIPTHRSSRSLSYIDLFEEEMYLYCGEDHPLFGAAHQGLTWARLQSFAFAGLGFHSPNMAISHRVRLSRQATGFDQEAIATLIRSGRYMGFLPDHYAAEFVRRGEMQAIAPRRFRYSCRFACLLRKSPQPSRATRLFADCLVAAHSDGTPVRAASLGGPH